MRLLPPGEGVGDRGVMSRVWRQVVHDSPSLRKEASGRAAES